MKQVLKNNGVDNVESMNYTHASQMIGELIRRRKEGLCTYKQAKTLAKYGEDGECTFEEAGAKIDAIARNGWRVPAA